MGDKNDNNEGTSANFGWTISNNRIIKQKSMTSSLKRNIETREMKGATFKKQDCQDLRSRTEIDTRADKFCAGSTFELHE